MFNFIQNMDWSVLSWIQETLKCGFLDFVMPLITKLGDVGAIWLICAVIMLFSKKYRKCGIMILIGVAMGFVIGNLCLKPLIARPRPCWIDSTVQMLVPIETDFSFPSGHTLASVIAATIITLNHRKFGFVAIPLAAIIAFSRLYLYLHFPTDVLASVCFGVLIGIAVYLIVKKTFPLAYNRIRKRAKT